MTALNKLQKEFLVHQFGSRVNFGPVERMLYGHDIATMPKLVKPLVGNTVPEAVVQPANEQDLVTLVNWAVEMAWSRPPMSYGCLSRVSAFR